MVAPMSEAPGKKEPLSGTHVLHLREPPRRAFVQVGETRAIARAGLLLVHVALVAERNIGIGGFKVFHSSNLLLDHQDSCCYPKRCQGGANKMFWRQPYWWWDTWQEGEEEVKVELKAEVVRLVNLYDHNAILDALKEALNTKADWTPDGPERDKILRVVLRLDDLTVTSS